ncbi:MAG: LCP family protein [Erysipelotrichaceae bacterium]|jgi:LCP family protein required for cell wall assembly|nr:LCP family protein [Erysipelotrichaceae bacterium]
MPLFNNKKKSSTKTPSSNNKKAVKKDNLLVYSYINFGLLFIIDVGAIILLLVINKLSVVSSNMFMFLNIVVLAVLILLNVVAIYINSNKMRPILKQIYIAFLVIILLIGGYGSYVVYSLMGSVEDTIVQEEEIKEEREVAFVVLKDSTITSVSGMAGKKVGVINNTAFIEGNVLALEEISNQGLSVSFVEFTEYVEMLQALFNKQIDVASVPADYVDLYSSIEGLEEHLENTKIIHTFSKNMTLTQENKTNIDVTKEPFSILIMGNDGQRHTDALMVMTVNPVNMIITMTSIPRDLFVPIACYNNNAKDKITHARVISRQCTIDTVEDLFDIDINFFVEINFQGVVDIVDAIGTIEVYSPVTFVGQNASDARGHYTVYVEEGLHPRTGLQVLAIARERKAPGFDDFVRQQNQQKIIMELIRQIIKMRSPTKAVEVFNAAGKNIETNMSMDQMLSLLSLGIQTMELTTIDSTVVFTMYSSRVIGYDSWHYDYGMELPLWIYKPYAGSIADNAAFIKNNLRVDKTLEYPGNFRYYAPWGGFDIIYFPSSYNETQVHDDLPDFMPTMIGWNLADAQAWASARGITLVVKPIKQGDPGFNANLGNNYIIDQSEKYGRLTSKFSTLTVSVIKFTITVPSFTNMKLEDVQTWANNNGVTLATRLIEKPVLSTDPTYGPLIGGKYVVAQDVSGEVDAGATVNVDVYEYVAGITVPNLIEMTGPAADALSSANLLIADSGVKVPNPYPDNTHDGHIGAQSDPAGSVVKIGATITYSLYEDYVAPTPPSP